MQLTELLTSAEGGDAIQQLSRQFGLSKKETRAAIEALMPAFSMGLQRQASNPQSAASLIEALASGHHAAYVEQPDAAFSKRGRADGNAILGHLFGNKEVSRAVAARAAKSTGLGKSLLKQMLPVLASMVMGSLFKGATGAAGGSRGQAAGGGILGQIIEGLGSGMASGARDQLRRGSGRRRRRSSGGNVLDELLGGILGGTAQRRTRRTMPRGQSDPVMPRSRRGSRRRSPAPMPSESQAGGSVFDEFLNGGDTMRRGRTGPAKRPQRRTRQRNSGGGSLTDIFGDMLEPGGDTSQEYRRKMGSVFDELLGN